MGSTPNSATHRFHVIVLIALAVAGLYWGRELLIPIALAVFLSFLLAPLATRLERAGLGRIPGALAAVVLAFVIIIGLGFLITEQLVSLVENLPEYEGNIRAKVEELQKTSSGFLNQATRSFRGLTRPLPPGPATAPEPGALSSESGHTSSWRLLPPGAAGQADLPAAEKAVPVRIVAPEGGLLSMIGRSLPSVLDPLATAVVVVVLTIFILIQRRDTRDRLISLAGQGQILFTTEAFDEMSTRISRYLFMQLVVNTLYAVPVAVGLALFGIPNALLWGLMGLVLRFIPYVGAWFTAAVGIILAIAVFPSWWGPLGVLIFFVSLEMFINNVIEPWLYSVGTGLSVLGVMLAVVFWTWLWGPVGLILATPITVCLTVVARYVPELRFLDILLGGQTTLEPTLKLVQRLLAMDRQEAIEIAERFRRSHTLLRLFDELLIPALQYAERERHRGRVDEQRTLFLNRTFRRIVDECAAKDAAQRAARPAGATEGPTTALGSAPLIPPSLARTVRIVCLPAGDEADELTGRMLEHLLRAQDYQIETAAFEALSGEMLAEVQESRADLVFISALPPGALIAARYLCKRVSSRWPDIPIRVGLWNAAGDVRTAREHLESCGNSKVVTNFAEALSETARVAQTLRPKA